MHAWNTSNTHFTIFNHSCRLQRRRKHTLLSLGGRPQCRYPRRSLQSFLHFPPHTVQDQPRRELAAHPKPNRHVSTHTRHFFPNKRLTNPSYFSTGRLHPTLYQDTDIPEMETEMAMYPGAKYLCEKLELRKMTSYTSDSTVSFTFPFALCPKTPTNKKSQIIVFRNTSSLPSNIWTQLHSKVRTLKNPFLLNSLLTHRHSLLFLLQDRNITFPISPAALPASREPDIGGTTHTMAVKAYG